jgi:hypothetical protein
MQFWMILTRFPALKNANIDLKAAAPGGRGQDLEGRLPPQVMWKSHNYTHLMEQPTIFYAAVVILAIAGSSQIDVILAWTYVAIRIVHSIWQATVNRIPIRVTLFATSSLFLIALAIRALQATLFAGA